MSFTYTPRLHLRRPRVGPWFLAAVLAAALIALGAWLAVDRYAGSDTEESTVALLDDFQIAANAADRPGMRALMTKDVVMTSLGNVFTGPDEVAYAAASAAATGVRLERLGPATVAGDYAVQVLGVTGTERPAPNLLAVSQIRNGKIARFWTFMLGSTEPFDNALR